MLGSDGVDMGDWLQQHIGGQSHQEQTHAYAL